MIKTDFLPRIVDPAIVDDVFTNGRKVFEAGVDADDRPHDADRVLDRRLPARAQHDPRRPTTGTGASTTARARSTSSSSSPRPSGDLGGGPPPVNWIADFRRLYDFTEAGRADLAVPPAKFNRAKRIDTRLVDLLKFLPAGSFGGDADPPPIQRNLAFRNLTRGRCCDSRPASRWPPTCRRTASRSPPLTQRQILQGNSGAELDDLTGRAATRARRTPLWFYILREAEFNGGRLAGVGGRIVAETFHRAMEGSASRSSATRPGGRRSAPTHDVPDGRPAAVRVRGQEPPAQPAGRLTPRTFVCI